MNWANDTGLPHRYKSFRQYCELIFRGPLADKTDPQKATYILLWLGQTGLEIFNSFNMSGDDQKKPAKNFDRLEKYTEPKSNFRIARYSLQHMKQDHNEPADSYMARLQNQALKCKFTNEEIENRLIEQLIIGTSLKQVQETLLGKDEKLKLEEAMDIARTKEATVRDMQLLASSTTSSKINDSTANIDAVKQPYVNNCQFCGSQHKPRKCPAWGSTCAKCHGRNHWAVVCKAFMVENSPDRIMQSGDKGQKYKDQNRSTNSRTGRVDHGKCSYQSGRRVHAVEEDESDYFDTLTFSCMTIDSTQQADSRDEVFACLEIKMPKQKNTQKCELKVKVDTGAQSNLLPLRIFRQMYPDRVDGDNLPIGTHARQTRLLAYNDTEIPQYGVITIPCRHGIRSRWSDTNFFVVDVQGPAIVGLRTCRGLGLVELNCEVHPPVDNCKPAIKSKDDLKKLYPDRFEGIGRFDGEYHITIDKNVPPVVHAPRRCPIHIKDEIKAELDKMRKLGVITEVDQPTDWVSSVAYSKKSNGSWRICLDPKDLNNAIKRTHHHTPTVEEITHKFSGQSVFSKLDARCGYWSVVLDEESSLLTTFNTPFGRYRYLRLPFGLCVSQDVFQQQMDFVIEKCPGVIGISDDVVVYGIDDADHDHNLHNLMEVARQHGLVFNLDKCLIKAHQITFYGTVYDKFGARPDPKKVETIKAIQEPKDASELQTFMGLATYMSNFIPNLSALSEPLRRLLKKDSEFQWNPSHCRAFQRIKDSICEKVILQHFDPNKATTIQVDASLQGLGSALLQDGKVVAFGSKSLNDAETRYANIEREMLAVVAACEKFRNFIYGKSFIVESDHKPLSMIKLKNLKAAPGRLQRMLLQIQDYDVTIRYKPGKEMVLADPLSRLNPLPGDSPEMDVRIHSSVTLFSDQKTKQLKDETNKDPELVMLREVIFHGFPDTRKELNTNLRKYWAYRDEMSLEDGIVMKGERVVIPESMRTEILERIHEAHQGIVKCKLRAKNSVFWPEINKDIENLVGKCQTCQEHKNTQVKEPLEPHEIPTRPWQIVGTDLFHWELSEYILISDYYSSFSIVRQIPTGDSTSTTIVKITKAVFAEQGIPEKVMSDNGPQYASAAYREFAASWNFKHVTSSPRYPQSNGFIERQVQTVKDTLTKAKQSGLDLNMAMLCLRTTPLDSRLPSPAELLYNRKLQANLPVKIPNEAPNRDAVAENLAHRKTEMKHYYDQPTKTLQPLTDGQSVYIQNPDTRKWSPGTVIERHTQPRSYKVQMPNQNILRRNRRHLRPARIYVRDDTNKQCDIPETITPPSDPQKSDLPNYHLGDCDVTPTDHSINRGYQTRSGRYVNPPSKYCE